MEDLLRKRDDKFDEVKANLSSYKVIVHSLMECYQKFHRVKDFKSRFERKFSSLGRRRDIVVKKVFVVYVYKHMIANGEIENNPDFWHYIQLKSCRNISGVNSFAVLLPPYPVDDTFNGCKHNCYYCPNETKANGADVDVARSYLLKEPAVQRGYRNGWSAINQMNDRMGSLLLQGLEVDKLELIIEGGTYTEYPMDFLRTYHRDLFYAANTFFDKECRPPESLEREIQMNMTGSVRIIGLCIETRPDAIDPDWIRFFRNSGVTRIQLGVQHTDDQILKKINRGHTFAQSCLAMQILKDNCFKVDIHLMPDLPLASPDLDRRMFDTVFTTDIIAPDQVKIYPCEVTPYTVIEKWHKAGTFTPYTDENPRLLIDVVKHAMTICPPWVRLPRIVRDIPLTYIRGGNRYGNLRQMLQDELNRDNVFVREIRSREIGRNPGYRFERAVYKCRCYRATGGTEYFISLESWDSKALFGFIRLRIPSRKHAPVFQCLRRKGLIRELHVYNWLVCVGNAAAKGVTQHRGTGKKLLQLAEFVSWAHGLHGTAVITGEGVRQYYHKQGYHDVETYVVKDFSYTLKMALSCFLIVWVFLLCKKIE